VNDDVFGGAVFFVFSAARLGSLPLASALQHVCRDVLE
jgi:hypothetical protein